MGVYGKTRNFAYMFLKKISIVNYKNIKEASLELSPKMNCFIGRNGQGKTNFLDAVYYLSFCRSAFNPIDSQLILHDEDFFVLEGMYGDQEWRNAECEVTTEEGEEGSEGLRIYCGMKRGTKKHFKKNKKEYKRLSEHIGLIPLVFVSPSDSLLIEGGSEERRHLMDVVIAQYDHLYIEQLANYNRALQQRNVLLKSEEEPDGQLLDILEQEMGRYGDAISAKRQAFVEELVPVFQHIYEYITRNEEGGAGSEETVSLRYVSHCQRGPLYDVIRRDRHKDRAVGYSLHGIHRDDLEMMLGDYSMKREGSQGQHKTFVLALKLAQFDFLRRTSQTIPLLLLDDIFDKLDASRVEQIVKLVSGDDFGQIFITDTNRDHLDSILSHSAMDYQLYTVSDGEILLTGNV